MTLVKKPYKIEYKQIKYKSFANGNKHVIKPARQQARPKISQLKDRYLSLSQPIIIWPNSAEMPINKIDIEFGSLIFLNFMCDGKKLCGQTIENDKIK